ncbi:oxalate decarboxylase [Fistulina hepatica ATCC 64428]|nr:oxalate decarboxylase [Fistulina hepatica ATCC 64428]
MLSLAQGLVCVALVAGLSVAAPAAFAGADGVAAMRLEYRADASSSEISAVTTYAAATATVSPISTNANDPIWDENDPEYPQPIRGQLGASVIGPDNIPVDKQNPDLLAPPTTDHGSLPNSKWPFALSPMRLQTGVDVMPVATKMASVDMRLLPGAIRELHWHKNAEWAYVLKGKTQVTAVDAEGRNFLATVGPGDLWYFPPGIPHSLQATDDDPEGSEFILIFDSGDFDEDATFLLTDWLDHVPYEVIQKNFAVSNPDAFAHIPDEELYIFPGTPPSDDAVAPYSPQGQVPNPFAFNLSTMASTKLSGGSVKIVDSTIFNISKTIAVAEVYVNPGAMRELHWHPTQDEWSLFLEGEARMTIFASVGTAHTFDYQPGDIGYVPEAMGHYVENTGNTTLKYLEVFIFDRIIPLTRNVLNATFQIFKTDRFQDISLNQWLALTPPSLVKAHLGLDDATIAQLSKTKPVVIQG